MENESKDQNKEFEADILLKKNQPLNIEGSQFSKSVQVEMDEKIAAGIFKYAASDTTQELGGILLGHYNEKDGIYNITVSVAIKALYTEAAKGSVKFTHKTWEYINQERENKYPDYKMVGWYHTHPGFGIFLSSHDKFIHQNFFNLPWQIAYVVDPIAGEHGFFGWDKGVLSEVAFETVYEPIPTIKTPLLNSPNRELSFSPFKSIVTTLLVVGLLFFGGFNYVLNQEAKAVNVNLANQLAALKEHVSNLENEKAMIEESYQELSKKNEALSSLNSLYEYTVNEGDTLWGISEKYLGNGYLYTDIATINFISEPDLLLPGTKLLLPIR